MRTSLRSVPLVINAYVSGLIRQSSSSYIFTMELKFMAFTRARLASFLVVIAMVSFSQPLQHHDEHHKCVHDEIAVKDLPIISAAVGLYHDAEDRHSRSIEVTDIRRYKRNSPPQFAYIRITPYFIEPLDASIRDKLISPTGPLMRAINTMSSLLLVRPLMDNLTLTPSCRQTFSHGTANQGKCMELNFRTECGIFTIPDQFVGATMVCETADDPSTCHEEGPQGLGLATDFLVFVGTNSQQSNCGSGTFAFSSSCAKDTYHRPAAGYINICAEQFLSSDGVGEDDTVLYNILLHELVHALGFSRHRLSDFHDGNLNFYDPQVTGTYNGNEITGIQSPKVLEVGRSYFGCLDLPYVPLENNGDESAANSHWEARVLHHETMAAFLPKDYSVLSNFTLAYFEDSGWYKVNYSSLEGLNQLDLLWGKGLGCPFVLEQCSKDTYPYLCNTTRTYQCTFDLVSRGKCTDSNRYFDGCAVVIPESVRSSCIQQKNITDDNEALEMFGHSSMCVDIGLTSSTSSSMTAYPFCYSYQYFSNGSSLFHDGVTGVQIMAYNETVWCNSSSVNETSHALQRRNGRLKVYCPRSNQLNVRLALAGQVEYQTDTKNPNQVQDMESQDTNSTTWAGILIAVIAVLVVLVGFGLPLLIGAIKALDCDQQVDRSYDTVNDPNVISISRTPSNLTEIVVV